VGQVRRVDVPEAYVRRVLVNTATDAWRSRRGPPTVELDEARLPLPPRDTITPFDVATRSLGRPIIVGGNPAAMAIAPSGTITCVASNNGTVTVVNLATGRAGRPIRIGGFPGGSTVAITPNGKTAYVGTSRGHGGAVTPINLATDTAGTPRRCTCRSAGPWPVGCG
jgi:DNA-binding beta-propeller fold protein YncE